MKKPLLFATILSLFFLTSCGFKLNVMAGEHFTKKTTLSIGNYDDPLGTVRELNYLLKAEGFNVVSASSASNAVKYKDPFNDIATNKDLQKIFNITNINSIYSIKLNYYCSQDNVRYNSFGLSVIDQNGKVVMDGYFAGMTKKRQNVLKKAAKKLAQQIK